MTSTETPVGLSRYDAQMQNVLESRANEFSQLDLFIDLMKEARTRLEIIAKPHGNVVKMDCGILVDNDVGVFCTHWVLWVYPPNDRQEDPLEVADLSYRYDNSNPTNTAESRYPVSLSTCTAVTPERVTPDQAAPRLAEAITSHAVQLRLRGLCAPRYL